MEYGFDRFISRARLRFNLNLMLNESASALLAASGISFLIALAYVSAGRRADVAVVMLSLIPAGIFFIAGILRKWRSQSDAAQEADRIFAGKDSLSSSMFFESVERQSAFHRLQLENTEKLCGGFNIGQIRFNVPLRRFALLLVMCLLTFILMRFDESPAVREKRIAEQTTLDKSAQMAKELREELRKFEDSLTQEERELFDREKMKSLSEALRETRDPREALLQYANLERELMRMADADSIREDDSMLSEIASKLREDQRTRLLGDKLGEKDYSGAMKELMDMMPQMPDADSGKSLESAREQAAKTERHTDKMERELAKRESMTSQLAESMRRLSKSASKSTRDLDRAGKEKAAQGSLSESTLDTLDMDLKEFKGDISALDKAMKMFKARKAFGDKSGDLALKLAAAQDKMSDKACASCSSAGASNSPQNGAGIGSAASGNFNNTDREHGRDGYDTRLSGQKNNSGSSDKKVEESSYGSGKATAGAVKKNVEFKKQMENFIRREDVPDSMKGAVRKYFNSIHDDIKSN